MKSTWSLISCQIEWDVKKSVVYCFFSSVLELDWQSLPWNFLWGQREDFFVQNCLFDSFQPCSVGSVWYLAMQIPAGGRERALLDFSFPPLSFTPCWLSPHQNCFSGSSHALLKLAETGRTWMSGCNKGKAFPSSKLALMTWGWMECWKLERVSRRAMKTGKGLENTLYNGKCFCPKKVEVVDAEG